MYTALCCTAYCVQCELCVTFTESWLAQFVIVVIALRSERPESRASISSRDGRLFFLFAIASRLSLGSAYSTILVAETAGREAHLTTLANARLDFMSGSLYPLPRTSFNVFVRY